MVTKKMGIASITGRSAGHRPVTTVRQTGHMDWKDVPTRTLDVNGTSFAYRALGPDTGVPVIFLHHLMAVLDDWDPGVIDGIAAKRRVIAFDNRGVGASGGAVPHTIEEMGRDAIAFIRAMGLSQVDLLGFSLGGGVAQMVALQAPDCACRNRAAGWWRYRRDQQDCRHRLPQSGIDAEGSTALPVFSPHPGWQACGKRVFLSPESAHD